MPDVEPWDIALNNRQREDVGIYMTYKRFDDMLDRVRLDERERIIALLETEAQGIVEQFADYIEADFVYALIALIKGEQK